MQRWGAPRPARRLRGASMRWEGLTPHRGTLFVRQLARAGCLTTRTPTAVSRAVVGAIFTRFDGVQPQEGQGMSRNRSIIGFVTGWIALLVVVLAGFAQVGSAAPSLQAEVRNCYRVALQETPRWISSVTWIVDSSRLLVVDPHRDALLSYDPQGRSTLLRPVQSSGTAKVLPAMVARTEEGFLLEKVDGHFLGLDGQLRAIRENVPLWKSAAASEHVGSLYQWTVAGDSLVGFGTLTRPDQSFNRGFLRAPLRLDGKAEMLKAFANEDFYLLSGYSYLASLGDEAYFVLMDKRPAIYRAAPGSGVERLKAF